MENVDEVNIEKQIIEELEKFSKNSNGSVDGLDLEADFVDLGVIDSFGLLELLTSLEAKFNVRMNFAALDPVEYTSVKNLTNQFKLAMQS